MTKTSAALDRFRAKVQVGAPGHCWEWTATRDRGGYGRFYLRGRLTAAHRFSYQTFVGPIPEGLEIDHLCHNRGCVNPQHLDVVTRRENIKRSDSPAGLSMRENRCKRGHEFTPENTRWREKSGYQFRVCRECLLATQRRAGARYRARQKAGLV